jgi:hypothetical protein
MATDLSGLFGGNLTPDEQQQQILEARAAQFASLNPSQQLAFMGYKAGANVGQGLAQAAGVDIQDPAIKRATMLRQLAQDFDVTTVKGLAQYAQRLKQAGFNEEAAKLGQAITTRQQQEAQANLTAAKSVKELQALERSDQARKAIADLGPEATEEDILKVVRQYGDVKDILSGMEASQRKKLEIQARQDDLKSRLEAQIQMAKDRGATQKEITEMQIQGRKDLAAFAASLKEGKPKVLPASLQKSEDDDLTKVDSFEAQRTALASSIQALTPDPKTGKATLELSPGRIAGYSYQLATGSSTPEARAYERLKSAVDTAVNLQVSAEKGVQTDADVLRFAKALIASYGRNDTKATLEALQRFNESIQIAENKTKQRINSRRSSQGVEPYYIAGQNINVTPANAQTAAPATPVSSSGWSIRVKQ